MKTYRKPFLSIDKLLAKLVRRGLKIDVPKSQAEDFLSAVNYYRFTGYALPFMKTRTRFSAGARFSTIRELCLFDRKVRDLMFEALEIVELQFRTIFSREFASRHGALGYLDSQCFSFRREYRKTIRRVMADFLKSRELCAEHLKATYVDPPIWAIVEVVTFGKISRLFELLNRAEQLPIAKPYGIRSDYLSQYMHHMSVLRNRCAHYARMYDLSFWSDPSRPAPYSFSEFKEWRQIKRRNGLSTNPKHPIFYQFALVYRLLKNCPQNVFNRDDWRNRVSDLFDHVPNVPGFDLKGNMGVPSDHATSWLWV